MQDSLTELLGTHLATVESEMPYSPICLDTILACNFLAAGLTGYISECHSTPVTSRLH